MWVFFLVALAQDLPPEEDFEIDVPDDHAQEDHDATLGLGHKNTLDLGEDDPAIPNFIEQAKRKPPKPVNFHLRPQETEPLGKPTPMYVSAFNEKTVVVEQPVLISSSLTDFLARHPQGFALIATFKTPSHTLRQQHVFTADQVFPNDPTWHFLKMALPISQRSTPIQLRVEVKPTGSEDSKVLFQQTTVFTQP